MKEAPSVLDFATTSSADRNLRHNLPGESPTGCTNGCTGDADLARLIAHWATLPAHIRAAIVALLDAAQPG
jgi:hypothetical protein